MQEGKKQLFHAAENGTAFYIFFNGVRQAAAGDAGGTLREGPY